MSDTGHRARRAAIRLTAAIAASAVVAACGGSGEQGGNPEAPNAAQPGSEGRQVPAADVASIKTANGAIRACRAGGTADARIREAVDVLLAVYRSEGPEARYESNLNAVPINLRGVVENAERGLRRCGQTTEAQRLASALEQG